MCRSIMGRSMKCCSIEVSFAAKGASRRIFAAVAYPQSSRHVVFARERGFSEQEDNSPLGHP
jgi:hypothetical protein